MERHLVRPATRDSLVKYTTELPTAGRVEYERSTSLGDLGTSTNLLFKANLGEVEVLTHKVTMTLNDKDPKQLPILQRATTILIAEGYPRLPIHERVDLEGKTYRVSTAETYIGERTANGVDFGTRRDPETVVVEDPHGIQRFVMKSFPDEGRVDKPTEGLNSLLAARQYVALVSDEFFYKSPNMDADIKDQEHGWLTATEVGNILFLASYQESSQAA